MLDNATISVKVWELRRIVWAASKHLADALNEGWEPFQVTVDQHGDATVWLRR